MRLLKVLAVTVAMLFLGGAVIAAEPVRDAGPIFFHASKAAPVPQPRARDAGTRLYFAPSKSLGGEGLPGVNQLREKRVQQSPQQNSAP